MVGKSKGLGHTRPALLVFGVSLLVASSSYGDPGTRIPVAQSLSEMCQRPRGIVRRRKPTPVRKDNGPWFGAAETHRNTGISYGMYGGLNATILSYTGISFWEHAKASTGLWTLPTKEINFSKWIREQPWKLETERGNIMHGSLVFTPGANRQPLVVLLAGTQAAASRYRERRVARSFLYRGMNVLIVEGRTNMELTAAEVERIEPAFGGFEEAKDLLALWNEIAAVRTQCVSSVHLYGASLAGRAGLLALSMMEEGEGYDSAFLVALMVNGLKAIRHVAGGWNGDSWHNGDHFLFGRYNESIRRFVRKHENLYPELTSEQHGQMNVYNYFLGISAPYWLEKYQDHPDELSDWWTGEPPANAEELEGILNLYRWPTPLGKPILLLHARDDFVIPVESTQRYCEHLRNEGALVECIYVDRGGHDGVDTAYESYWYYDEVVRFFQQAHVPYATELERTP